VQYIANLCKQMEPVNLQNLSYFVGHATGRAAHLWEAIKPAPRLRRRRHQNLAALELCAPKTPNAQPGAKITGRIRRSTCSLQTRAIDGGGGGGGVQLRRPARLVRGGGALDSYRRTGQQAGQWTQCSGGAERWPA
jgi:hypothetical protein